MIAVPGESTVDFSQLIPICAAAQPLFAAIGQALAGFRHTYGAEVQVSAPQLDRHPATYVFQHAGVTIAATPLPETVGKVDVFFDTVPAEPVELLLERYSGTPGWELVPTTDPDFARHFPLHRADDPRNAFYTAPGAMSLVQRDVGFGRLVLWIQAESYTAQLARYRAEPRSVN